MDSSAEILIVEDENSVARFLYQAVAEAGYSPTACGNGSVALEIALGQQFDLILLDWMLPGLSGLEVCQRLRERGVLTPVNLVEMLVRNLLENAVKYTPEEGKVDLSACAHSPSLRINNDAPPILKEDFERLFEPFFRPDPARTSRTGGNGLGLPIALSIAEQQGWRLELHQEDGRFEASVVFASLESL